jgi:nitrite reductase/ring-hydroxylating ferredoxin subunit
VLDGQVICPGHQWKFDPVTGQAEDQDVCQAVFATQVTEEGAVLVDPTPRTVTDPHAVSTTPAGSTDPR